MSSLQELIEIDNEFFIRVIKKNLRLEKSKKIDWNREIFQYFYYKGKDLGFSVETNSGMVKKIDNKYYKRYYKKHKVYPHEYIVDLCWCHEKQSNYENWLDMVLELEWKPETPRREIDEDFYKLMDIHAFKKIGIAGCSYKGKLMRNEEINIFLDKFSKTVVNLPWKIEDEAYLFIFFDNFTYKDGGVHSFTIETDGVITPRNEIQYLE